MKLKYTRSAFHFNKPKPWMLLASFFLTSCAAKTTLPPLVPSLEYSNNVKSGLVHNKPNEHLVMRQYESGNAAAPQASLASMQQYETQPFLNQTERRARMAALGLEPADYNGPLSLGDPGVSASLWRESSSQPEFFRDSRAWQPMDLITIVISETSEGKKEADTEVKSQSSIKAALESLFGVEDSVTKRNPQVNLDNLISASTQNDFKGEGETNRKDTLKGTISGMIVEVLPSGILRIEGSKIISVNNEEQIMVLSGLVRSRDISSDNVVQSSRLANMRIDYYGKGQIGDLQHEGWLSRIVRNVWPF